MLSEACFQHPIFSRYRDCISGLLSAGRLPDCNGLNKNWPAPLQAHSGRLLQFVPEDEIDDSLDYESRIYRSGQISTRTDNWHDFFNAVIWMHFPRLKTSFNRCHYQVIQTSGDKQRGALRDAITLLDECGALLLYQDAGVRELVLQHRWQELFCEMRPMWRHGINLIPIGHALLEKSLQPYKSMTAQVLLLQAGQLPADLDELDAAISDIFLGLSGEISPAQLTPLPLMGIPGWWPQQSKAGFYQDLQVFRPLRSAAKNPPLISLINAR